MSNSESREIIINESQASINEEFITRNINFVDSSIDDAFKEFTSKITSTVNSTFTNFNNDHDDKIESAKHDHSKHIEKLNEEIKDIKRGILIKQDVANKQKEKIGNSIYKMVNFRIKAKAFNDLKYITTESKLIKQQEHILVDCYFKKKYIQKIVSAWRIIAHSNVKARITAKHYKNFTDSYNEGKQEFNAEISELAETLKRLEGEIAREIDERKKLSSMYDEAMSEAAGQFIMSNEVFKDFNTSNVQTPKERTLNREKKKTGNSTIIY
jgi:hypothetical protein